MTAFGTETITSFASVLARRNIKHWLSATASPLLKCKPHCSLRNMAHLKSIGSFTRRDVEPLMWSGGYTSKREELERLPNTLQSLTLGGSGVTG